MANSFLLLHVCVFHIPFGGYPSSFSFREFNKHITLRQNETQLVEKVTFVNLLCAHVGYFDTCLCGNQMGRKSTAEKIIEGIDEDEDATLWIVCYDFPEHTNLCQFYPNRDRIIQGPGGYMVQYSVFIGSLPASLALSELVKTYHGKALRLKLEPGQAYLDGFST